MPKYLAAIQRPDTFDPFRESPAVIRDIDLLNEEMGAEGSRFFAGGLESPSRAKIAPQTTERKHGRPDGPFLEAKEYIGGSWILKCTNMDEAIAWGKKAAGACRTPVEVRAFLEIPSQ